MYKPANVEYLLQISSFAWEWDFLLITTFIYWNTKWTVICQNGTSLVFKKYWVLLRFNIAYSIQQQYSKTIKFAKVDLSFFFCVPLFNNTEWKILTFLCKYLNFLKILGVWYRYCKVESSRQPSLQLWLCPSFRHFWMECLKNLDR